MASTSMPAFERAKSSFLQRHFSETVNSPSRASASSFEEEDDVLELRSMDDPQEDITAAPNSTSLQLPPFSPPPLAVSRSARSLATPLSRSLDNFSEASAAPPPPSGGSLVPTPVVSVRSSMPSAQEVHRAARDQEINERHSSVAASPARFTRQQVIGRLANCADALGYERPMSLSCAGEILLSLSDAVLSAIISSPTSELWLLHTFYSSLNVVQAHINQETRRGSLSSRVSSGTPDQSFPWPLFDMANYEHSCESYIPEKTTLMGSLTFWKSSDNFINLDNVVIIANLPKLSPSEMIDPAGEDAGVTVLKALIELLSNGMLSHVGAVNSICFPSGRRDDVPSDSSSSQPFKLKGVAFVEFSTQDEAMKAERTLDSFPFALSTRSDGDWSDAYLRCRCLKLYARSADLNTSLGSGGGSVEVESFDLPESPTNNISGDVYGGDLGSVEHEEDGDDDVDADVGLINVDEAIAAALAPLEQYKKSDADLMAKMEEKRKRAASQYAVGAAAIAAMRGGLDKSGVVDEDDDDDDEMLRLAESDEGREIKSAAASLSNFETKLEEAIVRRNFNKVASHEKNITETYGKIVAKTIYSAGGDGNGIFGSEGTLQMVLRLLNKTGKEVEERELENAESEEEEEEEEDDEGGEEDAGFQDERNLWRRCLQGERLRAAALLRRMKSAQKSYSRLSSRAGRVTRELAEMKRSFLAANDRNNAINQRFAQLEQVRESLNRQNEAQGERLRAQREAIARLGRFQRLCESSEARVRQMNLQLVEGGRERDELQAKLAASEKENDELRKKERAARYALQVGRDLGEEDDDYDDDGDDDASEETKEGEARRCEVNRFLKASRDMLGCLGSASESILKELEASIDTSLLSVRQRREELLRIEAERANMERRKSIEAKMCCICLVQERTTLLLPCKHMCLCSGCSQDGRLTKCPICRTDIDSIMEVYG